MADFWDKFKKSAKETGEKIAKGTKDLTQTARLKLEISNLEGKIKSTIEGLGKSVYDLYASGKSSDEIMEAIKKSDQEVKNIEASIKEKQEALSKIGKEEEPKEETPKE